MLNLLLDSKKLDLKRPGVAEGLDIDLRRIKKLDHTDKPMGANTLSVIATNGLYVDSINYKLQYGRRTENGKFVPLGSSRTLSHEKLPYL